MDIIQRLLSILRIDEERRVLLLACLLGVAIQMRSDRYEC